MGASIVLVPLVLAALIAPPAQVPVLVSVSLMLVLELVISYPDDVVAEKFSSLIVRDALKLGCVIAAELKTATSAAPGAVPPQLAPALKSVPVLLQVLLAA